VQVVKSRKLKKVFISQAAVRISFEHDATTSRVIDTSPASFCTSRGRQCHFHPHRSKVDQKRCKHHRYMPTTWFLRNHLLACTKTHFRGQKCASMQGTHRWRQHRNRKKSSRIYMINWNTLMFDVRMDADMIVINRWRSAPGGINFSYELRSQTQNSASWKIHRWWSTHDRCEMRFRSF